MLASPVGPVGTVQHNNVFTAAKGTIVRFPADFSEQPVTTDHTEAIDVAGPQFIRRALAMLNGNDPFPVPKAVENAIRNLAREVFDGLPKGGNPLLLR